MLSELSDPSGAAKIIINLAQLALVAAGFTLVFGRRRWALRLAAVGIFLAAASVYVPEALGLQITLLALAPFIALFGGILLLQRVVDAIYGRHAGGFVAGTYLVRAFDALGGFIGVAVVVVLVIWALMIAR